MSTWYEAVKDEDLDEFESSQEIDLKVAGNVLITASRTGLVIRHRHGKVTGIGLRLWLDRAQLYRALKHTGAFGMTPSQLLSFDPNAPIVCDLDGNEAVITRAQTGLDAGRALGDIVTDTGQDGFPAFFDLGNYSVKKIYDNRAEK